MARNVLRRGRGKVQPFPFPSLLQSHVLRLGVPLAFVPRAMVVVVLHPGQQRSEVLSSSSPRLLAAPHPTILGGAPLQFGSA